jgi:hypothetical protein
MSELELLKPYTRATIMESGCSKISRSIILLGTSLLPLDQAVFSNARVTLLSTDHFNCISSMGLVKKLALLTEVLF